MVHSKVVTHLTSADNPPNLALCYPGKWSRNNKEGSTLTLMQFLQQMTYEWLDYVKLNPVYDSTYLADKVKCLERYLANNKLVGRQKLTPSKCKQLIINAELRLMEKDKDIEINQDEAMEDVGCEERNDSGEIDSDGILEPDIGYDKAIGGMSESMKLVEDYE